jgi:signal transduction histidine kinase
VSDGHLGPVKQAWTVRLTYPVAGPTGLPEALLISPIDLDALQRRLFGHLPIGAVVAVLDGDNRVVVRSEKQLDRVGKMAAASILPELAQLRQESRPAPGSTGVSRLFVDIGIGGERRLFALIRVPQTDWVAVATLPEEETLQGYVLLRNRVALALASVLVLVALAAWLVSRSILVPISGLARAARGVASGDVSCRAPERGPREIREVAHEFNRMVRANHQAGEQLRTSEHHYRALIQHIPVAVMTFRTDGAVEVFNEKACALLRMAPQDIQGAHLDDALWHFVRADGQRLQPEAHPVNRVLQARRALPPTLLGVVSQGRQRDGASPAVAAVAPHTWVMVTGYPQIDETGQVSRVIALFLDITAQRKADELLVAKEAAEAASQAKSLFLSRVSHELRTPLNAISGFSELMLLDPETPGATKDKVRHIFEAGRHLLALINQLMDLSRIEAGTLPTSLRPLEAWDVVRECVAICGPMAQAHGLDLAESSDDAAAAPVVWAMADPTHVRQILMNLLSNAIKYNRPGGLIRVSLDRQPGPGQSPGSVGLCVLDTGVGLSGADLHGLFQPFNRLSASHGTIEGHGLGLSISRQLARAMGGDITVRSAPGEGSAFTLWLRRATPPG